MRGGTGARAVTDLDDLLDRAWRVARLLPSEVLGQARFRASPDVRRALVENVERYAYPPLTWHGEERLFGAVLVSDMTLPNWTLRLEVDA